MLRDDDIDVITIWVGSEDNEYVFISGFEIMKFSTEDKLIGFISYTGDNLVPYIIGIGEGFTFFKSNH